MDNVLIISFVIVVAIVIIVAAILVYHQMLLINEINKRLLILTKDSIDHERNTQEELQSALAELERQANEQSTSTETYNEDLGLDKDFNPHDVQEEYDNR